MPFPDPAGGAYSAPSDPLAALRRKWEERKGMREGR